MCALDNKDGVNDWSEQNQASRTNGDFLEALHCVIAAINRHGKVVVQNITQIEGEQSEQDQADQNLKVKIRISDLIGFG